MKKLIVFISIVFFYSCKKDAIVFKQFNELQNSCINKQRVDYTIINWPVLSSLTKDTIFWEYDNNLEVKGAVQNNVNILKLISKQILLDSMFITVISMNDSAIITLYKNRPVNALIFNAANSKFKEYLFEYDINNQLSYYSYRENNNLTPSKYFSNGAGLDSAVFYGGSTSAPATNNFSQFSYKYNTANIPFLPFVLSVPNQAQSFLFGKPICENLIEAYLWGLISPYTSQKILESYLLENSFSKEYIKATVQCDNHTLTYAIDDIKIINGFK